MHDVHEAGGVPAIINQLIKKVPLRVIVSQLLVKPLKENVAGAEIKNEEIIHPIEHPISPVVVCRSSTEILLKMELLSRSVGRSVCDHFPVVKLFVAIHKIKPLS